MYTNIIDSRRRDAQKKIWKLLNFMLENPKEKLWVRDIVKKFNIWNVTLDNFFWSSFKLEKNKKIYILDNEQKELFKKIINIIEKTKINEKDAKTKRLLFAFLYYKLTLK